jgi:tRNA (mo5U34)-methyltransferase
LEIGVTSFRNLSLDDRIIEEVNDLLDWRAAALLPDGRVSGKVSPGKRANPVKLPDKRIKLLDEFIGLGGKSVLEVGCFEGLHTLGLLHFTDDVTAIDLRPVNVCKTLMRLSLHGAAAKVFLADCEHLDASFGRFDVVFHFGVLYHLDNPVQHLANLATLADTLYCDTHVARENVPLKTEIVDGETFHYAPLGEQGWADPFSGAHAFSKNLAMESLERALQRAGYSQRRVVQVRDERNGPRILLIASRTLDLAHVPDAREQPS